MHISLKYGVSAVALLAAVSFAQAQTSERQGGEKGGAAEHMQGEKGATGQHQGGSAGERGGKEGGAQRGETDRSGRTAQKEQGRAETRTGSERGTANERPAQPGRQNAQEEKRAQDQRTQGRRTAKSGPNAGSTEGSQAGESTQREGERNVQDRENRQRQSNAGGAARGGNAGVNENDRGNAGRVNFHVSAPQRTELHDVLRRDSAIRVYHSGDVRFNVRVGERIPDTIEFYNPPPRFVEIDPEFRRYRILVLDDEILVIDPETREIVDVIPA